MNDIFGGMFRSMFGFGKRDHFPGGLSEDDAFNRDGFPGGGHFFFGSPFFGGQQIGENSEPGEHNERHDPFGRGMPDIFEHFQKIFEGMSGIDGHYLPGIEGGSIEENQNPRDEMLKQPDSGPKQSPFFGSAFRAPDINIPDMYKAQRSHTVGDTDLDEDIRRGNLDAVFGPSSMIVPHQPPGGVQTQPRPESFRTFKSVSVRTYRNADGQIEERKTVRDGRGNEEIVVTRAVDGQRHTVTKRRDNTGSEQISETFDNMDESDKDGFNSRWNSRSHKSPAGPDMLDPHTQRIFGNLFGNGFPGFGWGNGRDS